MVDLLVSAATGGTYSGGSGEPNNPYQISSVADWQELMATPTDWGGHFTLTSDIDLNDVAIAPVGNDANNFTGVFDGNDRIIRNADVHIPGGDYVGLFGYLGWGGQIKNLGVENTSVFGQNYVGGLVGRNSGTISNCYSTASVDGNDGVGGLVGYSYGAITNCYSTGSVSGISYVGGLVGDGGGITNCYSTGSVSGGSYVGGLVGHGGGITNCYSTGSVSGTGDYVGGLVGYNDKYSTISNCYSTGSVSGTSYVGGLVGANDGGGRIFGTISNCYSTGSVNGTGDYVGGLVGSGDPNLVTASFWDKDTSGWTISAGGTPKTTAEMKTIKTFTEAGWDFVGESANGPSDIWAMPPEGGYPILWWQLDPLPPLPTFSGGSGTPADPYIIAGPADINSIGYNPRLMDRHYVLAQDVNLAQERFYIIGSNIYPFTGVFDGNDHKVWNFTWSSTGRDYIGLFGYVGPGGQIKNLGVENVDANAVNGHYVGGLVGWNEGTISDCYSTGSVSGTGYYVGGLVGLNDGPITTCYSTASVSGCDYVGGLVGENYYYYGTISNCYSSGSVGGTYGVGGLVGSNYYGGSISNCYSNGSVRGDFCVGGLVGENSYDSTISNCYSTGPVSGGYYVGGLVGYNGGTISNCYSSGTVSGYKDVGGLVGANDGTISNCYSTGSVSGGRYVGGLVGYWYAGAIISSFWDVNTSGWPTSSGGTPKTTAEMKTTSTFTDAGWDFVGETVNGPNDVWRMCVDGVEYPLLSWQFIPDFTCPDGVDILDLAFLVDRWLAECDETNNFCNCTDINHDELVNFFDFAILASHWLEGQ